MSGVSPDRTRFSYFTRRCYEEGRSKATLSRLTSTDTALSTERGYATRTLPQGAWRSRRTPTRVAALIAGLGGYFIGESNGSVLAAEPLQAEVTRVLQDDFGLVEVSDVVCPEQVKVDQGSEFQCTFTYAEQDQSVTVTVSSADGQVVVGAPE